MEEKFSLIKVPFLIIQGERD